MASRLHSAQPEEQVFLLTDFLVTVPQGQSLSLDIVSTPRASCPRGPGVQVYKDIGIATPKASPHWREMWGWLWLERHTISQPAYLRPSFPTHPSCLRASVAWHSAQEKGGTGPGLNSVSIQGELCCLGMAIVFTSQTVADRVIEENIHELYM